METVTIDQYMFLGILTILVFSLCFNFILFYKWHRSILTQELADNQRRRTSQRIAQLEASILEWGNGEGDYDGWYKSHKSIQEVR